MYLNFVRSTNEIAERMVRADGKHEEDSMRAEIEMLNEKITFYETDLADSDRQIADKLAEVHTLTLNLKKFQDEIVIIKSKATQFGRIMTKYDNCTSAYLDDMTELKAEPENIRLSFDKSAQNIRVKELRKAIETRKQMIKETDFGNRDDYHLEQQLQSARAQLAELQAKNESSFKASLKVEAAQHSGLKTKVLSKKSKRSSKESNRSKRTTRK